MYNFFIDKLNEKDVDHFTTDIGLKIRKDIFYKTYKTLLPEIRNLYSK